jgi:hypothetical protein
MPGLTSKATPLGDAAKMAVAFMAGTHRLTHSRNLMWQLPAIAEYTLRLASKVTPLGEAAEKAHAFIRRLIQGPNIAWQLSAIAEHTHGLASKATPLSEAAKMAHVFVARHVRSHADSLKVCASCGNYLSLLR